MPAEGKQTVQSDSKEFRLRVMEKAGVVGNDCGLSIRLSEIRLNRSSSFSDTSLLLRLLVRETLALDGVTQGWGWPPFGLFAGFCLPHMTCYCRNHGFIETTYVEAKIHIRRLEGTHRFRERLPIHILGISPGPAMRK